MSPSPLDLEPEEQEGAAAGGERPSKPRGGDEPRGARGARKRAANLRERLDDVFERTADWLEARGDEELAQVIREDRQAMSGGIVSLTRPMEWLRTPILLALGFVEPVLAFGRIVRVLAGRWSDRRAQVAIEREEEERLRLAEEPPPAEEPPDQPAAWG